MSHDFVVNQSNFFNRVYTHFKAYQAKQKNSSEYNLLSLLVDPQRNSIDVGAQKGIYAFFIAKYSKHVWAFEPNPDPRVINKLIRGAAKNISIFKCALSNQDGEATFYVPLTQRGNLSQVCGSLRQSLADKEKTVEMKVETRRLDNISAIHNVGFIKIDVEGFELQVLQGAEQLIRRDQPNLMVEIEERHAGKGVVENIINLMNEWGYTAFFLHRGIIQSYDCFNADMHQSEAALQDGAYVNNFFFIPRKLV